MDATPQSSKKARLATAAIILLCVVILLQLGILLQRQINAGSARAPAGTAAVTAPRSLGATLRSWFSPKPSPAVSPDRVWDPSDQIAHMHEQINRMFEQTVHESFQFPLAPAALSNATTAGGSAPFHDPFAHFNRMRREIDTLFALAMKDVEGAHPGFDDGWANLEITPGLSVRETPTEYDITVAIPGVDKSHLQLSMSGRILTIVVAAADPHHTSEEGRAAWAAHRTSRFERRLMLPAATSQYDTIKATCEDGVLRVIVPKASEAESAAGRITIT